MKKKLMFLFLLLFAICGLFAEEFDPKGDRPCTITVYRKELTLHCLGTYDVCINQSINVKLKNGEYTQINVNPGEYLIYAAVDGGTQIGKRWDALPLEINAGDKINIWIKPKLYWVQLVNEQDSPDFTSLNEVSEYSLLREK